MLATSDDVISKAVPFFHKQMITMAIGALRHDPPDEREISSITIAVNRKSKARVKAMLRSFRKKLHSYLDSASEEGEKEIVTQINFQLFDLTR